MAYTASTAFAGAFRHTVQSNVLRNLRDELVWGNPRFADQGRFDNASDQMMWLQYPDLSITTPLTPITEGTTPTARVLTQQVVTVQADQWAARQADRKLREFGETPDRAIPSRALYTYA